MKNLIVLLAALCLASQSLGAESCAVTTTSRTVIGAGYVTTWTIQSAANGSFTACDAGGETGGTVTVGTSMASNVVGAITSIEVNPGTAYTAGTDITIVDDSTDDVTGGILSSADYPLSVTATVRYPVQVMGAGGSWVSWTGPFEGPLELDLLNNSVDTATVVVRVFWENR